MGRREGRRGGDEESLEILQEGVDKSGDPQKFKSEGMAKATHSPAGAHEQQEVMIPGTCPSRGAGGGAGGGGGVCGERRIEHRKGLGEHVCRL